jgi:hypothetical protein
MFDCPDVPSTDLVASCPTLSRFIAYALHHTRLSHFVMLAGLLLLRRIKIRFHACRGSNGHRLFITAFMIASKVVCDGSYSNRTWCVVAQHMFSLQDMNQMEREMCGYLDWDLVSSLAPCDSPFMFPCSPR